MPDRAPRILALCGSARRESFNRRILDVAVRAAEAEGVPCTAVELRDHPLPLYDGDLEREQGLPEAAARLRELMAAHRGLLVASPEYNGHPTPLLVNTLDWMSRASGARPDLAPFAGTVGALVAASPGPLGGIRGLAAARVLLSNLGVTVLARQAAVGGVAGKVAPGGGLQDEGARQALEAVGRELARVVLALGG